MATTDNWFLILDEGADTWASILVEENSVTADSATVTYTVYDYQTVYADSPQISYDVESLVGTISGGATFPFASATADATSYFNVLISAVQKDLVASYSMRQPIDTQLYSTWRVLIGVEADSPTITYNHGGAVYSENLQPEYTVFTGVELDFPTVTYDVASQVTKDLSPSYAMTSNPLTATNVREVTYNVVSGVEKDGVFTSHVFTYAEKDAVCQNNVLGQTSSDAEVTFDVHSTVQLDGTFIYELLSPITVSSDFIQTYVVFSDSATVPNVIGMTLEKATATLLAAGFQVGTTTQVTLQ